MPVFPSGRLFSGKDLTPDFDVSLTSLAQPEKFDTTLPGNSGLNPTNAQFYTYLATLPSWSAAAVTNQSQFIAAATAIDASGPAAGVIKISASYNGDDLTPPNRPLPSGVQPDPTTCMIYVVPETLPGGFPQPAADGAAYSVAAIKASLPVVRSQSNGSGTGFGWHAVDHESGGMAQYGYRWIGMRFNVRADGGSTNYARVAANYLSRRIILDRCYLDGVTDETVGGTATTQPPGFLIDGRYNASLDSWYDNFMSAESEKQCISIINGGPTKIVGNPMLGNGECFMSGGASPVTPSAITNYPRDLEFRRNFCRQQFGANPLHGAFYQLATLGGNARTKRSSMTGAAYNAGTRTLTLSAGTFDTSQVSQPGGLQRIRRFWYVTAGAGVGSHGEVSTYNSTTSVTSADTTLTVMTGSAIDATSVIEVREAIQWISKNCFELKTMYRAYVEAIVCENGWDMDVSQRMIANLKTACAGTDVYAQTVNITLVNSMFLNCWGGIGISARPNGAGLAATAMHLQNVMLVATPHLNFVSVVSGSSYSMPFQVSADAITRRRITALNFQRANDALWADSNFDNSGTAHTLGSFVTDGYLAKDAPDNHIYGSAIGVGFEQGVSAYNHNVDTATASWRAGIFPSSSVTSPSTQYPNSVNPGAGFDTQYSTDTAPFVNPLYDFTDPSCDYSLKPADPLAALSAMGVDWPTLKGAVLNVRPAKTVVPYQWLGTETTVSVAHHLALTTTARAGLAGQQLAVQPVVAVADSGNATVTTDTSSVIAALVVESGSAASTGTLTKVAVSGLATFTDLGLASSSVIGSVCHWRYSRAGLPDLDGPSFTVLTSLAPSVR